MFAWWGQFVYRFRWPVLGVSLLLLVGSILAFRNGGTLKNSGGENTESGRAITLMHEQLPQSGPGGGIHLRPRLRQPDDGGAGTRLQTSGACRPAAAQG